MSADMRVGLFEETVFGQLALKKLGKVPENFRLYVAGISPQPPKAWTHMAVTGAEFRESKSGPNKGKLNIMVPGTSRTVRVPRSELQECGQIQQSAPTKA